LLEVLMQTSQYAGIPAAVQALNAAADVLDVAPA
jgi:alkylhydroperoxidase/carboxymuconolactone decarboxylase family protein YurZ